MKNNLRREYIKKRNELDKTLRERFSRQIWQNVKSLDEYKRAKNVLCYASFGSEVETSFMLKGILADGKRLYLPKCDVKSHTMSACAVADLADLREGAYGIKEPLGEAISPQELDLVIAPLVAFDKAMVRLGYGGGYYDRFLAAANAASAGVAFSVQECEGLPKEPTDILMDKIVTECGVIV